MPERRKLQGAIVAPRLNIVIEHQSICLMVVPLLRNALPAYSFPSKDLSRPVGAQGRKD